MKDTLMTCVRVCLKGNNMSYSLRTDKADEDIHAIINYIAEDSQSIDIAIKYLEVLENAIMQLADFPEIGCVPRTLKPRNIECNS